MGTKSGTGITNKSGVLNVYEAISNTQNKQEWQYYAESASTVRTHTRLSKPAKHSCQKHHYQGEDGRTNKKNVQHKQQSVFFS